MLGPGHIVRTPERRNWPIVLVVLLVLLTACKGEGEYRRVKLFPNGQGEATRPAQAAQVPLRVAVAPVISPRENFKLYGALLDYVSRRIDRPVDFIQRRTYAEINELVRYGRADVAFVCDYAFVEGERDFGMQILVAPVVMGQRWYQSYIIVPNDSAAKTFFDLRERVFAFSDPLSSSGWLYPTDLLRQAGETPESFFKRTVFTSSHDNTIRAVADKLVDGGAVDSLVYEFLLHRDPMFGEKTRVIGVSESWGTPPVVVHPGIDPELRRQLEGIFLTMHEDEAGRRVLDPLMIDGFVPADDRSYDDVRRMAALARERR